MESPITSTNTKAGTAGGLILVLLFKININELLSTAIVAALGAAVSFGVSVLLKYTMKRWNRK